VNVPWAKKLTIALERLDEFKAILGNLKNDPSKLM
jgi:3-methyladenine DNA glycosylase AlkC